MKYNGKITLQNSVSGGHRTFLIRTQPTDSKFAPGKRVIALLTGPNNEADYRPFGFVTNDDIQIWSSKSTPFYQDIRKILLYPDRYPTVTQHFETKCRKCNRTLTTPQSIEAGIGPECASRE